MVNGWRQTYEETVDGSFIHVDDFESVADLVEYLEELLRDRERMRAYQVWRERKEVYVDNMQWNCELCLKLAQHHRKRSNSGSKEHYVIPSIFDHVESLQKCK